MWAAELQPTYATELKLTAVAVGGLPGDLPKLFEDIENTVYWGLGLEGLIGIYREHPELDLRRLLNERGKKVYNQANHMCIFDLITKHPFMSSDDIIDKSHKDWYHEIKGLLDGENLGQHVPSTNIFIYHGGLDELISMDNTIDLIKIYCSHNVPVKYKYLFHLI